MNVQRRIKRNLLGAAADLPTSTWPPEWKRRTGSGFSGADLIYVSSNDTQRRYVYLYGEVEAAIEFDLPIDLRLTAEPGYQLRFLYQPTQQASENPRVVAYFNAGAHFWSRELQTSTVNAAVEAPRDWLICDDKIDLRDEITQPKAALAFQSGLFDPATAAGDATSEPERDQPITQEPAWPPSPGELHFSGKALGTEVSPEMAKGVSVFVHLKPLALSTSEPTPEFDGSGARYWVEKDGRSYMPICRGGGAHHLTLPVAEDCGWAGGGVYTGTSAYASFTDQNEAGQAGLQVAPTDPDADDDAQPIAKAWEIRHDADDPGANGRTATLRFESVYHADPHEMLGCIVGPYKLDIADHGLPDYWPSVAEAETIDLHVKVHYAVSGNPEPGIAVEWRHEDELLETLFTGEDGLAVFGYPPTADATIIAVVDSPYKPETDTQAFAVKTIPTRKWAQFELSVGATEISPEDNWRILPGQTYQLTVKPRPDNVLIGQALALTVEPAQSLQLEPTGDRPLTADGLTWSITTASNASGSFALRLGCIRFKQPPTLNGTTNKLPALTIDEAVDGQLAPLAALDTLTALVPHYDDMQSTDRISVTWTGAAGSPAEGSHSTSPVEVGTIGRKEIPLPMAVIAYSLGQSVTVSYTVTRDGEPLPAPDALTLPVGVLPQSALEPSRPRILQAAQNGNGTELDMNSVSGDATVRIDSWPHVAHGQRVWISVEGTKTDGSDYVKRWLGTNNWVSEAWYLQGYGEVTIPYVDLQRLRDGSTLKLTFKASFNQSTNEGQATTFPPRTYTVRAAMDLSAPRVKQATGAVPSQQLNPVAAKDALTVVIPEYGVQPGDQVRVTWAGTAGEGSHTTPTQALPPNREIDIPVQVIAYNLGRSVTVTYTVTRNNEPRPPSDALTLALQAMPAEALEPSRPRILQAAQNGNGTELDMNGVSGNATVRVDSWPHVAHGQRVWISVEGTKIDGSDYVKRWLGTNNWVSEAWYLQGYGEVTIPYVDLQRLRDGSTLKLTFKASFNQSTDDAHATTFPLRTYTVRAAMDLTAPRVKQASGAAPSQQLNPVAAKDALTVVIPEYGVLPGDQVRVTWTGTAGEGSHTTPAQALPPNREIDIPVLVIAYNLGRSVTVTYTVTRNSEPRPPSDALTLTLQAMPVEALEPSRPRILQAAQNGNGPELDVDGVSGDVTVRVDSWPHVAHGQRVWISVEGTKIDDSDYVKRWLGTNNWVSEAWYLQGYGEVTIPHSDLRGLRDGSTLKLTFKASFNKSTNESQATTFPLRTYTVKQVMITPTIDSLKDANDNDIPAGTFERYTVSTRLKLSGQASKGRDVAIVDDWYGYEVLKGQATANPLTGTWECTLDVEVRNFRFYAKGLYPISPVYSAVRLVNVVPLINPTLTNVTDTDYNEVPNGNSTSSTELRLYGRASRGQTIEVFDDSGASAVSKGEVESHILDGYWALRITVGPGEHRLYAKSLYHSGAPVYSNIRTLTVVRP